MRESVFRNIMQENIFLFLICQKKLDIGTASVKVVHGKRCQGYLSCNDAPSKQLVKSAILDNKESSTGFLMWISSYCISCVFQWYARQKLTYNVFVYNDTKPTHAPKVFSHVDSVIGLVCFKVNLILLKLSMRLHFLDVHVNWQILKGNK